VQFDVACQHLQKAIVLNPSNAKFRHSLGCAYEAAEQWQKAVDAFQHAVNKDPFNTQFLMSLVKPLSHLKRYMRVVEVRKYSRVLLESHALSQKTSGEPPHFLTSTT
jgi:tetratricopeptide (TPR) repeat protein